MSLQKNRMIAASKNFQTSVNIAFDFDNAQKLADFIPTSEAIKFIDEAVLSARNVNQTEEKTSEKTRIKLWRIWLFTDGFVRAVSIR